MKRLRVRPRTPLRGVLRVPGDLHIGQLALLWAALGQGESLVSGLGARPDHALLCDALRAMGVPVASTPAGVRVMGVGLRGLKLPSGALRAGDSITTLEILTALLSAQHFGTRIEAEGAALTHSLRTLIVPLRARGAHVAGRTGEDGDVFAPVSVAPLFADEPLREGEIEIPEGDAATKLALLLSGLYVPGSTVVSEGMLSRDHAERALMRLGAGIETAGPVTLLSRNDPLETWPGFAWQIPGDFSLACYVMAAALAVPGSDITLKGVGLNRSRTAFLDVLRHVGADVQVTPKGDVAGDEPTGDIRVRASRLRGATVAGELAVRVADDVTALGALAPCLKGRLAARDLAGLRSRRPDPVRGMSALLRSVGFECTDYADGFDVHPLAAGAPAITLQDEMTPELTLLGCVLALSASGDSLIAHPEPANALYPGFVDALAALGAGFAWEELP